VPIRHRRGVTEKRSSRLRPVSDLIDVDQNRQKRPISLPHRANAGDFSRGSFDLLFGQDKSSTGRELTYLLRQDENFLGKKTAFVTFKAKSPGGTAFRHFQLSLQAA
jgi:hypothetical protein